VIESGYKVTPGLYQSLLSRPEGFFAKLFTEMVLSPELQSNTWKHSYPERLRDRPREAAATSISGSGNCCQNMNGANSGRFGFLEDESAIYYPLEPDKRGKFVR
jgi:hypothetical protein